MNDIELIRSDNGSFDWSFNEFDIENVVGDQQLVSSTIHQTLLQESELEQELYSKDGTIINRYAILPFISSTKILICSEIESRCTMIQGIKDANVTLSNKEDGGIVMSIELIKDDGGVVTIGRI